MPLGLAPTTDVSTSGVRRLVELAAGQRRFFVLLGLGFLIAAFAYRNPVAGAWVGFLFAGYAAVANDSIQTIGTFIASNRGKPWWMLWLFIGGIFVVTVAYSWIVYDGDVSHQRLAAKGFEQSPTSFSYLQVAAPLFLLLLTRLRMPVSTTFLLLTSFATEASSVAAVMSKSLTGYALAFGIAIAVWMALSRFMQRWQRTPAHPGWRVAQWGTTGVLWSVWLMQDAANIAVYLPRQLSLAYFLGFAGAIFLGLGLLFRMGGERVQEVVDEKSDVVDVRAATLIDLVYAFILFYFKVVSAVPMSTTWVFLGLLAGREVAMSLRGTSNRGIRYAARLMAKDVFFAGIGLLVSLLLAIAVNEPLRAAAASALGL